VKKVLLVVAAAVGFLLVAATGFVLSRIHRYDESTHKRYDFPYPEVMRSNDPAVLARGKHLAESIGVCTTCHGADMAGGHEDALGPLGRVVMPNVTTGRGARGEVYTDLEMSRLLRHGVKRDGTTVRMMPVHEMAWWPEEDVSAVISYLRSLPAVDGDPGLVEVSAFGKVLDTLDMAIPFDVARRVEHGPIPKAPPAGPTVAYGEKLAINCSGCHGSHFSGGPIPGAPPDMPVPPNLTADPSGLGRYDLAAFQRAMREGLSKSGAKLRPPMPVDVLRNMNDTEITALWLFLRSLPPTPFGKR